MRLRVFCLCNSLGSDAIYGDGKDRVESEVRSRINSSALASSLKCLIARQGEMSNRYLNV